MAHSHNKRHGGYRGHNKPKDLVGTWKKLLGYCRRYLAVFIRSPFSAQQRAPC